MDEKKLKALATELAKGLKTEADLNAFSRMLTKLTPQDDLCLRPERETGFRQPASALVTRYQRDPAGRLTATISLSL